MNDDVGYRSTSRSARSSTALEVRAYQAPLSIPTFAPLIFANTETFLALEDHRYYRVSSGLHISGRATARWATAYFDRMWADAPGPPDRYLSP